MTTTSQSNSAPVKMALFVLCLATLVLGFVALYMSYNSLDTAKANLRAMPPAWQPTVAMAVSSKWDIPGWNCSNTTTKEPGQPERLVKQSCTSGTRIELESPSQ